MSCFLILATACTNTSEKQNCSGSKDKFNEAQKINTIVAYQTFLENYGTCEYGGNARKLIDSIFKNIEIKSASLNGGQRWDFGGRYKNNLSIQVTKSDGKQESVAADNIAQEDGLLLEFTDSFNDAEVAQISICNRLVFKIPDTIQVNNRQWLLRKKEITINKIENGFAYPTDDSEVPSQSGLVNGEFFFDYWNQAIGASWKFTSKEKIVTKNYTYKITSTPAWINFTKYGVELKNIARTKNE